MHKQHPFSFETMTEQKTYYEPKTNKFQEKRNVTNSYINPVETSFLQGPRLAAQEKKMKERAMAKALEIELAATEDSGSGFNVERVPSDEKQTELSNNGS